MSDLANKVISDSPPRMGRKPLGRNTEDTSAVVIRFEAETLAAIEALVGKFGRAKFVREAVMHELERRKA